MPVAAIATAALAAGSTIYSANKNSKAINKGVQAQQQAADRAVDLEEQRYNDLAPWREFGIGALQQLGQANNIAIPQAAINGTGSAVQSAGAAYLQDNPDVAAEVQRQINNPRSDWYGLSPEQAAQRHYETFGRNEGRTFAPPQQAPTPTSQAQTPAAPSGTGGDSRFSNFYASPDYAFRVREGSNAISNNAAARGLLDSGATGKALIDYGQQQGSAEFSNWYNRLAQAAGIGQAATVQSGGALSNQGGIIQNAAQNQASSYLARAQNSSNLIGSLAGIGSGLIGNISGMGNSNAYRNVPVNNSTVSVPSVTPFNPAQSNVSGLIPAGTGLYGGLF